MRYPPSVMAEESKSDRMKTAYELALERLESQGIERPRQESFSDETRREMEEVRKKAQGDLAQAEILHRKRLAGLFDPAARQQEQEDYALERKRIETERDRKLEKLRRERRG